MNKRQYLLILLIFICLFVSCKKKESSINYKFTDKDTSLAEILVKSKLVVGVIPDFPPLCFYDDNQNIVGFDIDLLTAVTEYLDIDIEFVPVDLNSQWKLLNEDKIDCIAGGFNYDEGLINSCEMTIPYIKNALVALVLKENGYKKLTDLSRKPVGVRKNSKAIRFIYFHPSLITTFGYINTYDTRQEGITGLNKKEIDAFITDIIIASEYITQEKGLYSVLEEGLESIFCCYALKKGNKSLKIVIEDVLVQLEKTGVVEGISKKWFNQNLSIIEQVIE